MDRGEALRTYDRDYWEAELRSARERAKGDGLVRSGEAMLYARRPVERFLDVAAGPGYLLDELSSLFPAHPDLFHAVEMFPPEEHTNHPNYKIGDVGNLQGHYDAGVCVEVVEHLTPTMLSQLVSGLAKISKPNTLWLFNTGMPDYVRNEDPGYLDPLKRGHVVSYGLPALKHIFEPFGFKVSGLPGKSFAFIAEYQPAYGDLSDFTKRFYSPLSENVVLLKEAALFYLAAFEAARSSYYQEESAQRTRWALGLTDQVRALRDALLPKKAGEASEGA
jgi:hypothetical protein